MINELLNYHSTLRNIENQIDSFLNVSVPHFKYIFVVYHSVFTRCSSITTAFPPNCTKATKTLERKAEIICRQKQ